MLAASALFVGALTITAGVWNHTQAEAADHEREMLLAEFVELTGIRRAPSSARVRNEWTHSEMAKAAIQWGRQMKGRVLLSRELDQHIRRVETVREEHRFDGYLGVVIGLLLTIAAAIAIVRRSEPGGVSASS